MSQIMRLINQYQKTVEIAVRKIKSETGVKDIFRSWQEGKIPQTKRFDEKLEYNFHGTGCVVTAGNMEADFDFGPDGRYDGFDLWRLELFLEMNASLQESFNEYVLTPTDLEKDFYALIEKKAIYNPKWFPGGSLYYLKVGGCQKDGVIGTKVRKTK